ncbi:hypothetical protein ES705_30677 [subsurface metagenome]
MTIIIEPGDFARAKVVWRNNAALPLAPSLRWDLRKEGLITTWKEGPVIVAPEVSPGLQGEADVYCQVPTDWLGTEIDAKLMVIGLEGARWQEDSVYETAAEAKFELIQHTIYPYAYVYDGDVEITNATYRIDPFTPSAWAAKKLADSVASEAAKNGSRVIELKAYVDTGPLFWTDIKIELTATPIGGVTAAGVGAIGIPIWAGILIAALAIIGVIVAFTILVKTIAGLFQHKALSEEIKATWSRETLISVIGDFEAKLELTPTPPETLAEKSDQELRDYCNVLARGIVPPGAEIPWALVVVGGLAVLGVGAAVALAPKKKE